MKVLVLNKNFLPIKFISHYTAIGKIYCGRAEPVTVINDASRTYSWKEWLDESITDHWPCNQKFVQGVVQRVAIPEIIHCLYYSRIPSNNTRLTRKNILERDNHICYICGKQFGPGSLTIDHIIPRSRGGKNTWENLAACCKKCNEVKGQSLLSEMGIKKVHCIPIQPRTSNIQRLKQEIKGETHNAWKYFGL